VTDYVFGGCDSLGRPIKMLPSRMKRMTPVQRAWIGALIEGEGCVTLRSAPYQPHQAVVTVVNCDPEILSALLRVTGTGVVKPRPAPSGISKLQGYTWTVMRRLEIESLVNQCAKYSPKLQRIYA
jgi:hypothetical protein